MRSQDVLHEAKETERSVEPGLVLDQADAGSIDPGLPEGRDVSPLRERDPELQPVHRLEHTERGPRLASATGRNREKSTRFRKDLKKKIGLAHRHAAEHDRTRLERVGDPSDSQASADGVNDLARRC